MTHIHTPIRLVLLTLMLALATTLHSFAQLVNWRSFAPNQQAVSASIGLDYGLVYGIGYAKRFNTRLPLVVNADYTFPSGRTLLDDFNVRMGGQVEVLHAGNLSATVKVNGIFRRYESSEVRLLNWGAELTGLVGYYRPTWYAAAEVSFDKAVITQVKHSAFVLENLPELRSGWYIPAGGNFQYGVQAGTSFGRTDLSLKAGRVINQDFRLTPFFPFYAQLRISQRF